MCFNVIALLWPQISAIISSSLLIIAIEDQIKTISKQSFWGSLFRNASQCESNFTTIVRFSHLSLSLGSSPFKDFNYRNRKGDNETLEAEVESDESDESQIEPKLNSNILDSIREFEYKAIVFWLFRFE